MTDLVREFQIFAKPVGARCNLRCKYCYYIKKLNLDPDQGSGLMPDFILERYIRQHIEASTEKVKCFSWHGGEPTIAGIDFFRKVVRLQKKHIPPGREVINGIQTNGTLLNDEWCRFMADEGFILGISIDGPGDLHNNFRISLTDQPTLDRVLKGYELLKVNKVATEILCVVNSGNVMYPEKVYDFLKQLDPRFITFLPLVEPAAAGVSAASVGSLHFGHFLSAVFDEWIENDIGRVKVQIFEEAVRPAFKLEHTLCIFKKNCGGVPVLESNGDFYSCDHYVDRTHLVGNITEGTIAGFLDSEQQKSFGNAKSATLPKYCRKCDVLEMCNGECPKNRFIKTPDGEPGLNYLCEGYKYFFRHCKPFVEAISVLKPGT
jgi:uncharacterized protein